VPLIINNERIYTAHASKQSKISFKIFEAHTSVLVPLMILPVMPFMTTVKISFTCVLMLILLERRGWSLPLALKRLRSKLAGRYRKQSTRRAFARRMKLNS